MRLAKYIALIVLAVLVGICGMVRVSPFVVGLGCFIAAYAGYVLGRE